MVLRFKGATPKLTRKTITLKGQIKAGSRDHTCPTCHGTGKDHGHTCETCHGTGHVK